MSSVRERGTNPPVEQRRERLLNELPEGFILVYTARHRLYLADTVRPGVLCHDGDKWFYVSFRAREEAGRETDLPVREEPDLGTFLEQVRAEHLMLERRLLPATLEERIRSELSPEDYSDLTPALMNLRQVKDEFERACLRQAARQSNQAHDRVPRVLEPGMQEVELAAEVESAAREAGHEGILVHERFDAYLPYGLIGTGKSLLVDGTYARVPHGTGLSRALPWGAGKQPVQAGEPVVVDVGGVHHGYNADVSRTYVVGEADSDVRRAHQDLETLIDRLLNQLQAGVRVSQPYHETLEFADQRRGPGELQGTSTGRAGFVGHGVGLAIDEPPILGPESDKALRSGTSITLELWVRLPECGAVKLEETVLIEESGCDSLSSRPHTLYQVPKQEG